MSFIGSLWGKDFKGNYFDLLGVWFGCREYYFDFVFKRDELWEIKGYDWWKFILIGIWKNGISYEGGE